MKINWGKVGRVILAVASIGCSEVIAGLIGRGRKTKEAAQAVQAILDELQKQEEEKQQASLKDKKPETP